MRVFAVSILLVAAQGCSAVVGPEPAGPAGATAAGGTAQQDAELLRYGKAQFIRCNSCHAVGTDSDLLEGPSFASIVGRPAASVAGYPYSDELRALDMRWDETLLDRWLEDPDTFVPEMCLRFTGISNPRARAALIAYLREPAE